MTGPVVTDEAVAAAAKVFYGAAYGSVGEAGNKALHDGAREALEAAYLVDAPKPQAIIEEVADVLHGEKHSESCTFANPANCDKWHESYREADVLRRSGVFDLPVDAPRPMPTEVEIAERVCQIFMDGGAARTHAQEAASEIADAVMALLSGGAK